MELYKGFWIRDGSRTDRGAVDDSDWRLFTSLLTSDDTVLDVGAHIGTTTRHFADTSAEVLAFEPHPDNWELLCRNTAGSKAILVRAALTSSRGWGDLNVSRGTMSHTLTPLRGRIGTVRVATETFADAVAWTTQWGTKRNCTALKVDCEGSEFDFMDVLCALPPQVTKLALEFHRMYRTIGTGNKRPRLPTPQRALAEQVIESLREQDFEFIDGPRPTPKTYERNWSLVAARTRA